MTRRADLPPWSTNRHPKKPVKLLSLDRGGGGGTCDTSERKWHCRLKDSGLGCRHRRRSRVSLHSVDLNSHQTSRHKQIWARVQSLKGDWVIWGGSACWLWFRDLEGLAFICQTDNLRSKPASVTPSDTTKRVKRHFSPDNVFWEYCVCI